MPIRNGGRSILVLGGGIGGVAAARALRRRLDRRHRIVLVDRATDHVFAPSLPWVIVGQRTMAQITRPLDGLTRRGIDVIRAEVLRVDPATRGVTLDSGQPITADYVVVSLGADLDPTSIPGLAAAGHNLYDAAGARSLFEELRALPSGRLIVLTAAPAYKCPAAPYEAAMLLDGWLRRHGRRADVTVAVYAAEPGPMGVAGPRVSAGVREMLAARTIAYHPLHQVTGVDRAARRVTFGSGTDTSFDLLAYVPAHRAPAAVRDSGLTDASGWIPVNRTTLETSHAGVFAIGDVTCIPLAMGKPLPKAGVFAHRQAEAVAKRIAAEINGTGARGAFDGWGECFIETGDGRAGMGRGNFYAEPFPEVALRAPSWRWHAAKVMFEKWWLYRQI
ncbi:MAG: FAD/NAD(P)-binding oxidoreductase [Acidobacteriota bacterium]